MRSRGENVVEGRLLSVKELQDYLRVGRNCAMLFGENVGARVKIGRRVLYDRRIIDTAVDAMTEAPEPKRVYEPVLLADIRP